MPGCNPVVWKIGPPLSAFFVCRRCSWLGGGDPELGPDAQTGVAQRHLADASFVTSAGRRSPPARWNVPSRWPAPSPNIYGRPIPLTASSSLRTESAATPAPLLLERLASDDPAYRPRALSNEQFGTLRALLDRIVPQAAFGIDLAALLDAQLAAGTGDGWRFASGSRRRSWPPGDRVVAFFEDHDPRPLRRGPSRRGRRRTGRQAPPGRPFQCDIWSSRLIRTRLSGWILESAPPVIITSARPGR